MFRIVQKLFQRGAPVEFPFSFEHSRMSTAPQLKPFPSSFLEIDILPVFGNTKIILAHIEKHNCMASGGIDVINMVP